MVDGVLELGQRIRGRQIQCEATGRLRVAGMSDVHLLVRDFIIKLKHR